MRPHTILPALLGCGAASMFAQGTAQLTGRITDATAAVVPATAVSVINTETGARRNIESNAQDTTRPPYCRPEAIRSRCLVALATNAPPIEWLLQQVRRSR